jgi:hypothetical protein
VQIGLHSSFWWGCHGREHLGALHEGNNTAAGRDAGSGAGIRTRRPARLPQSWTKPIKGMLGACTWSVSSRSVAAPSPQVLVPCPRLLYGILPRRYMSSLERTFYRRPLPRPQKSAVTRQHQAHSLSSRLVTQRSCTARRRAGVQVRSECLGGHIEDFGVFISSFVVRDCDSCFLGRLGIDCERQPSDTGGISAGSFNGSVLFALTAAAAR